MRTIMYVLSLSLIAGSAQAITVTGTVAEPAGRPAAGADLWLYRISYQQQTTTTTLVTTGRAAADGSFSLDDPQGQPDAQPRPQWDVYVRLAGFPILAQNVWDPIKPIALKLAVPVTREVSLTKSDGTPLPGVTLVPLSFSPVLQSRWMPRIIVGDVARLAAVTSDAAGRVALLMPLETARVGLEVAGPGVAAVAVDLDVTPPAPKLALQPAGSLKAKVVYPDASKVAGLKISLQLVQSIQGRTRLSQSKRTMTDAQGVFVAAGLTPGRWSLAVLDQPGDAIYRINSRYVEIKPGEETKLEVKAQPTVAVRGRIVDASTGTGVPDLAVTHNAGGTTKTGADGRFLLHCTSGQGQLQFGPYDRLVGATTFYNVMVMPDRPLDVPDIPVNVARQLEVVVRNAAGPLPQYVRVVAEQMHGQPWGGRDEGSCDAQGRCVLKRVTGGEAKLHAYAGDLGSEVVSIRVEEQREPVQLVLKPGMRAATKVRVVYADGTPLAKGTINFEGSRATPQSSWGSYGLTDANGVRENHGVDPGFTYKYIVSVPGCPTISTDEWVSVAGETHDFGTLTLHPEPGFIAGVVVDDAGHPVSGAMVFNGTDGPQVVKTASDDQGRFRVDGLYAGEAYIFVQAAGHGVNAACVPVGSGDLKLVLPRTQRGALGAPLPLAPLPLTPDAARSLARQVLIETLTRPGFGQGHRMPLLTILARVDGDEALKLAGLTGGAADRVRMEIARGLLAQDVDKGLALLQAVPYAECRVDVLLDVAEANRETRPELTLRCLTEARLAFPQILDTNRRALRAARIGADLLPSDAAAGKAILIAARDDLLSLGDRAGADERVQVAAYLAEADLPAALAMLKMRDGHIYLTIARHVAATHPDEALTLIETYSDSWGKMQSLQQLLPYLPPHRFAQSRDVLLRMDRWQTGATLIRMCLSAPRERLADWIEEVRGLLEPPAPEQRGDGIQSTGERETQGVAVLALMARRLGYQEAREIMLRAVLSRLRNRTWFQPAGATVRDADGHTDPLVATSDLRLARAVALMEPKLARRLVPADALPDQRDLGPYAAAVAVLDPSRVAEVLRQMPVGDGDKDWALQRATADVAEELLQTPEERETTLLQRDQDWPCLPLANVTASVTR